MKKLMLVTVLGLSLVLPMAAQAEEATHAAPAEAAAEMVTEITFADGSHGVIHDGHVYIKGIKDAKTVAPDGEHKLEDGTTITVLNGMVVAPEAAEDTAPAATEGAAH